MPLWLGSVKPKIHAMFKKLLISSFSAVLRHPLDSGIQVCPPLDRQRAQRPRNGLRSPITSSLPARMGGGSDCHPGSATRRDDEPVVTAAKQDFIEVLADIRTQQAGDLVRRVRLARSLRELWFMRTEVFNLVAHHRDQAEASHRMAGLGAHFPPAATRSFNGRLGVAPA